MSDVRIAERAGVTGAALAVGWSEELTASVAIAGTLRRGGDGGSHAGVMQPNMLVLRLTPTECERLQGFPDGYTQVPYRKKPAADVPRYKAIGNSWAVPVVRWLGGRIQAEAARVSIACVMDVYLEILDDCADLFI